MEEDRIPGRMYLVKINYTYVLQKLFTRMLAKARGEADSGGTQKSLTLPHIAKVETNKQAKEQRPSSTKSHLESNSNKNGSL